MILDPFLVKSGWRAAQQSGQVAQHWVKKIVEKCLKPKKVRENKRIHKGTRKQIDLIADLEESVLRVEAKNKIPAVGSQALRRLRDQLDEAHTAGKKTIVVGGDKVSSDRIGEVIKHFERAGLKDGVDFEIILSITDSVDGLKWS